MPPVVETRGLSRRYGKRWVLARLDLTVEAGERLLVVGSNGSGKTTLLRILSTLLTASVGELRLFGMDPERDRTAIRERLALVSHQTGIYEDLSAMDNLRFLSRLTGRPVPPGLLARVGLEERTYPVRQYSAGMRKRLALAGLLLQEPDLVLLDEPFAQLDPSGMDQIEGFIRELPGTVIVASHQVERAGRLCDRALLLHEGLPRWMGPAGEAWQAWQALHGAP